MAYAKLPNNKYIKVPDDWTREQVDEVVYRDFPELFPDRQPESPGVVDTASKVAGALLKGATSPVTTDAEANIILGMPQMPGDIPPPMPDVPQDVSFADILPPEGTAAGDAPMPALDLMVPAPLTREQRDSLPVDVVKAYDEERALARENQQKLAYASGAVPSYDEAMSSVGTRSAYAIGQGLVGLLRYPFDTAALGRTTPFGGVDERGAPGTFSEGVNDLLVRLQEYFGKKSQEATPVGSEYLKSEDPRKFVPEGTASLAQTLPMILAPQTLVRDQAKKLPATLAAIFAGTTSQVDEKLKNSGLSPEAQYAIRAGKGLIEAGTEALPMEVLLKRWGDSWVKELANFMVKDVAGEYAAEAGDWLLSRLTYDKDTTVADLLQRMEDLTYQLPISLAGTAAAAKGVQAVEDRVLGTPGDRAKDALIKKLVGEQALKALKPSQPAPEVSPAQTSRRPSDVGPSAALAGVREEKAKEERKASAIAALSDMQTQARTSAELRRQEEIAAAEKQRAAEIEAQKQEAFARAEAEKKKAEEQKQKDYEEAQVQAAEAETELQKYMQSDTPPETTVMQQAFQKAVDAAIKKEIAAPETKKPEASTKEETVRLVHYSNKPGLTELDPAFHGTGISGAESKRKKNEPENWVDRTYLGFEDYQKEKGLGPHQYEAEVKMSDLYDFKADPKGLKPEGFPVGTASVTAYEKAIRDAGYKGYWVKGNTGRVAALFDKTPVTPVAPEIEKPAAKPEFTVGEKDKEGYIRYSTPYGGMIIKEGAEFAPRENSVVEFVVQEGERGKGRGKELFKKTMENYDPKTVSASVSSKPSAAIFYENGFVPINKPDASLEEVFDIIREMSSVTMVHKDSIEDKTQKTLETKGIEVKEEPVTEITIEAPKGQEPFVEPKIKLVPTRNGKGVRVHEGSERTGGFIPRLRSATNELSVLPPSSEHSSHADRLLREQAKDDVAANKPDYSKTARVLSNRNADVVSKAVKALENNGAPVENMLSGVRALYAQVNRKGSGAHHQPEQKAFGDKSYVLVSRKVLSRAANNPKDYELQSMVAEFIAHESAHSIDKGDRTVEGAEDSTPYATDMSLLFSVKRDSDNNIVLSDILGEMYSVYENNTLGLRDHFSYPFDTIDVLNAAKVYLREDSKFSHVKREAFAQLFALYHVNDSAGKQALKKVMPNAIRFMEELNEALSKKFDSVRARDVAVSRVFRVPEPAKRSGKGDVGKGESVRDAKSTEGESPKQDTGGNETGRGRDSEGSTDGGFVGKGTPFSIPKDFTVPKPGSKPASAKSVAPMPLTPKKEAQMATDGADAYVPHAKNTLKRYWQQYFTKESTVGPAVFELKLKMDADKNVGEFDNEEFVADFEKAMTKAFKVKRYNQIDAKNAEAVNDALLTGDVEELPTQELQETVAAMHAYIQRMSGGMLAAVKDMLEIERAKLSPNIQEELNAYLRTNGAEGKIPKDIRKHWELYQAIYNNLGSYLTRSYQAFHDKDWMKKVLKDEKIIEDAKSYIREQNPTLTDAEVMGEIKAILQSAKDRGNFFNAITKGRMAGQKDTSITKKKKDIAPEIRALLGEYKDPKLNFVNSASKMQYYLANHHFLMGVRRRGLGVFLFEKPIDDFSAEIAGDGYEALNPLAGLYTTEYFRDGMRDMVDSLVTEDWVRWAIRINSLVKIGKTAGSFATTVRNFLSAFNFAIMNGHFDLSPLAKSILVARSELFTHDKAWREYVRELIEMNVIHSSPRAEELKATLKDLSDSADAVYTHGAMQPVRKFLRFIGKAYQIGDDFWKILGYENELAMAKRQGLSEEQAKKKAAYRVRNGYPTYSMVAKAIRSLRRFPFTGVFVSFPYEIMRTYANQFKFMKEDYDAGNTEAFGRRLLGVTIMSSATSAAGYLSMMLWGLDSDDDEAIRSLLPPYQRNSTLIYTGFDENGYPTYIDASYYDAYDYLKRVPKAIINGNNEEVMDKIVDASREFIAPYLGTEILPGAILEVINNKKANGAPVYNETDSTLKQNADKINHLRRAVQPGTLSSVERIIDSYESDRRNTVDEVSAALGFKLGRFHLPYLLKGRAYDFVRNKEKADSIISRAIRSPNEMDAEDMVDTYERAIDAREKVYSDTRKLVRSAVKLGMPEQRVRLLLKAAGVSGRDIHALLSDGNIPRYRLSGQMVRKALIGARAKNVNQKKVKERREKIMQRIQIIRDLSNK